MVIPLRRICPRQVPTATGCRRRPFPLLALCVAINPHYASLISSSGGVLQQRQRTEATMASSKACAALVLLLAASMVSAAKQIDLGE